MAQEYLKQLVITNSGNSATIDWPGGSGAIIVQGTFKSATFKVRLQIKASTWSDFPGGSLTFTADGVGNFQLPPCKLRVEWSGGMGTVPDPVSVQIVLAPAWDGWFLDPNAL